MNRVNHAAVVVAGIVYWFLQAGWYTLFGQAWVQAIGFTPQQVQQMTQNASFIPYVTALVANIIIAYVISSVMVRTGPASVQRGLHVALVMWMGFVATHYATQYSFEQRPFTLFAINGGSALVGMLLCGVIVGAWTSKEKTA